MSTAPRTCVFCRSMTPAAELHPLYELDVCDACVHTDLGERVKAWSAVMESAQTAVHREFHGQLHESWHTRVAVRHANATLGDASFTTEHLGHALIKVFKPELQVGDPLFDDRVYVRSTTPQRTSILLEHRAIQSAIVEMLQLGCTVGFEGTTVIVEGTSAIKPSLREIMAAATAMLHHGLTLDAAPTG